MKNWKSLLGIVLIFLLGAISGGLATAVIARRGIDKAINGGPDLFREMIVRKLSHELSITPDQETKLSGIVMATQKEIQAARSEIRPRVAIALVHAQKEISSILTPEQAKKFARIAEVSREKWKRFDAETISP